MDSRTLKILGEDKLEKLKKSHVTICGLGGVGSYAAEAIARASVGKITLVDFDKVDISNINRQLFALHSTIGKYKALVAQERIKDINPSCEVNVKTVFIDEDTIPEILEECPDCLVDAIDSVKSKVELIVKSHQSGIYTISSMGAAEKTDTEKIVTGDISKTQVCGLAKAVRTRARKMGVSKGIKCVYSTELKEPKNDNRKDSEERSPLGSVSYIPSIFGLKIAGLVIGRITE